MSAAIYQEYITHFRIAEADKRFPTLLLFVERGRVRSLRLFHRSPHAVQNHLHNERRDALEIGQLIVVDPLITRVRDLELFIPGRNVVSTLNTRK